MGLSESIQAPISEAPGTGAIFMGGRLYSRVRSGLSKTLGVLLKLKCKSNVADYKHSVPDGTVLI
jgi:hypothetical protein